MTIRNQYGPITNDSYNPLEVSINEDVNLQDIDFANSDFTGWVGDPENLFKSPFSESITNSGTGSPKQIVLAFMSSLKTIQLGFGENNGGSFSNLKISLLGSGGATRSIFDESTNDTKLTSKNAEFDNDIANSILIEFYTTDTVSLSNITIQKARYNVVQVQGKQDNGNFGNLSLTNRGNAKVAIQEYGDTPSIDAFARLRVSEPFTLFDSKQLHDKQPLFWDEELGGNATSTHVQADANVEMTVTANADDYVIRQTKQRFNYQPGKGQLLFITFKCSCISGVTRRVGYFDDDGTGDHLTPNNGIFFQTNQTTASGITWNIAKNGTITESVSKDNWNVDTLDGSGDENNPSGLQLDLNYVQIAIIDFEWLGVGRVRVGFVINGIVIYTHYFNHSNIFPFDSVYMSTPNLPIRYDIQTDGTNGSTLNHICSTVISEGGVEKTGVLRTVESGDSFVTGYTTGNSYALLGVRLKDLYKDITVIPEGVTVVIGTSDSFKWSLELNPVINGTFTYNDEVNSSVQYAVGTTANTIATRGIKVGSGGGSTQSRESDVELKTALRIGSTIAGVKDELVLVFTPLSANVSQWSSLNIRELI